MPRTSSLSVLLALCAAVACTNAAPRKPSLPKWVTPAAAVDAALASGQCETPPPGDPNGVLPPERLCTGPVPARIAAFLRALPSGALHLPRPRLERSLSTTQKFTAMRGMGMQPDLMVWADDWEVRTLEGPDAHTTYFLLTGPVACGTRPNLARFEPVPSCRWPLTDVRGYQLKDGKLTDVSGQLIPKLPADTRAYRHYLALGGELNGPDGTRLARVPVMRWSMSFDHEGEHPNLLPPSDPRLFGGEDEAHLGFLVWDGRQWASFTVVPRNYWPCHPVESGVRPCDASDEMNDRFVRAAKTTD